MDKNLADEIISQDSRGILVVITGPTAAGKDTLINELSSKDPSLARVITTTSRKMREGESEGHPYHFISRDQFETKIAQGDFFEWVEFRGELYGTQKQTLKDVLSQNSVVVWKIEAKGVKNIKEKIKSSVERVVFIFLTGSSIEQMKKRVEDAGHTNRWNEPLVIWELKQYTDSEYLVVNSDANLAKAVSEIEAIIKAKKLEILPNRSSLQK